MTHKTREQWLNAAAKKLGKQFFAKGEHTLPAKIRVSCGFPRAGRKAIGQCWSPTSSADETHELFVSPVLAEPVRVLDVLLHELIHAAVGLDQKHSGNFKKLALNFGLSGRMTATYAEPGSLLYKQLQRIAAEIGEYPHAEMRDHLKLRAAAGKKHVCFKSPEIEGYVIGMPFAVYEAHGAPMDPNGNKMVPSRPQRLKQMENQ